jgi:4-amino-4-deoxy-L-arabinose transferase-like glycosyltransferase
MRKTLLSHKLLVVLLIAVSIRLAALVVFRDIFAFDQTGAIHGSEAYDTYTQNLLDTGVYGRQVGKPDAAIPPMYVLALSGLYRVFGRGALQVGLFHMALDCVSIVLLYHIGTRIFSGQRSALTTQHPALSADSVGALAGLLYALYPYLIFQNLTLIDTAFFMALLYAFILVMIVLRGRDRLDTGTWALAGLGGLMLGLAMLTRAILPPLAILVAVWFLFRLSLRQTILRLLPVAFIGVLVVLVWMVRNYAVYSQWIPMSLNSGENFYQGNSVYTIPYFRAGYDVQWVPIPPLKVEDRFGPAAAAERFALGAQYLREHPEQIPDLLWTKFLVHWSIDIAPRKNPVEGKVPRLDYQGNVIPETDSAGNLTLGQLPPGDPVGAYSTPLFDRVGRPVHMVYWGGLFALGFIGIVVTLRGWREVALLWFAQISMLLVYLIFHPSTRYRAPTDPLWFLFSAWALLWLWNGWRNRKMQLKSASANLRAA